MSFYTMLWRSCLFCKFITFRRIPKFSNVNSDFAKAATVSFQREPIPYICGLRARIECEPVSEHSTRSDRVTNIGYRLSLEAFPLPFGKSGFFLFFSSIKVRISFFDQIRDCLHFFCKPATADGHSNIIWTGRSDISQL